MTALVFVDTNVLVYDQDAAHPEKQRRATHWMQHLWRTRSGRLSVQVLNEFYAVVTRKLSPGLSLPAARALVDELATWAPVSLDLDVVRHAWTAQDRFQLSWWDALIVAAAQSAGCAYLLSEDLQPGQDLGGIRIVNPFQSEPESIASAGG